MYTAIVTSILTYGAHLRSEPIEKKRKSERMACVATTWSLRSTSTEALFAILNLPHLDLYCRNLAWKSAMRLADGCFMSRTFGNNKIIWGQDVEMEYITPIRRFDRNCRVVIPERDHWSMREELSETARRWGRMEEPVFSPKGLSWRRVTDYGLFLQYFRQKCWQLLSVVLRWQMRAYPEKG